MAAENAGSAARKAMFEELVGEEDARREDVEPLVRAELGGHAAAPTMTRGGSRFAAMR
jgi:hypothetical protein